MAATSILLVGATPVAAQDEAAAELPVAECEAPADAIGVAVFRFDNEYLSLIREAIQAAADAKGAHLDIVDGQNAQPTQNEQIDLFISKGVPAMAVNQVDRELANVTLDKAKAADIPVVFFNKEPLPEVLSTWDKAYYVGAKAEESGIMQGQLVIDYWNANPDADKNGDGILQYVMLSGPRRPPGRADPDGRVDQGHQRRRHRDRGAPEGDRRLEPAPGHRADERDLRAAWRRHRVRPRQQRQHGHRGRRGAQGERLLR